MDTSTLLLDFQINKIGYMFRNVDLLVQSLTHSLDQSLIKPDFPMQNRSMERLQWLGSSVLKMISGKYALQTSGVDVDEGGLTQKRIDISNVKSVQSEIGKTLFLKDGWRFMYVRVKSEKTTLPYDEFVKAILAAVFIDAGGASGGGFNAAEDVFVKLWKPYLGEQVVNEFVDCFPVPGPVRDVWRKDSELELMALKVEEILKDYYKFKNGLLLREAIIHKTFYGQIQNGVGIIHKPDYQRLEYLGDCVLEVVLAEYLFHAYPAMQKGSLQSKLISLQNENSLKKIANRLDLRWCVAMRFDPMWGSYDDIVESIIGAVYVDSGNLRDVRQFIIGLFGEGGLPEPESTVQIISQKIKSFQSDQLGYMFKNEGLVREALTHEQVPREGVQSNKYSIYDLQKVGNQVITLLATEYVVKTSKMNARGGALRSRKGYLTSKKVLREIAEGVLKLHGIVALPDHLLTTGYRKYEKYVRTIFGAVHADNLDGSEKTTGILRDLFFRLWNQYLIECPRESLCFELSAESYVTLREKLGVPLSYDAIAKIGRSIGHCFKGRKLLEQALTHRSARYFITDPKAVGDSTSLVFIACGLIQYILVVHYNPEFMHNIDNMKLLEDLQSTRFGENIPVLPNGFFDYKLLTEYALPSKYQTNNGLGLAVLGAVFVDICGGGVLDNLEACSEYFYDRLKRIELELGKRDAQPKPAGLASTPSVVSPPKQIVSSSSAPQIRPVETISCKPMKPSSVVAPQAPSAKPIVVVGNTHQSQTSHSQLQFEKKYYLKERVTLAHSPTNSEELMFPALCRYTEIYWYEVDRDGSNRRLVEPPDNSDEYESDWVYVGLSSTEANRVPATLRKLWQIVPQSNQTQTPAQSTHSPAVPSRSKPVVTVPHPTNRIVTSPPQTLESVKPAAVVAPVKQAPAAKPTPIRNTLTRTATPEFELKFYMKRRVTLEHDPTNWEERAFPVLCRYTEIHWYEVDRDGNNKRRLVEPPHDCDEYELDWVYFGVLGVYLRKWQVAPPETTGPRYARIPTTTIHPECSSTPKTTALYSDGRSSLAGPVSHRLSSRNSSDAQKSNEFGSSSYKFTSENESSHQSSSVPRNNYLEAPPSSSRYSSSTSSRTPSSTAYHPEHNSWGILNQAAAAEVKPTTPPRFKPNPTRSSPHESSYSPVPLRRKKWEDFVTREDEHLSRQQELSSRLANENIMTEQKLSPEPTFIDYITAAIFIICIYAFYKFYTT